jgi:hypothetical protein
MMILECSSFFSNEASHTGENHRREEPATGARG